MTDFADDADDEAPAGSDPLHLMQRTMRMSWGFAPEQAWVLARELAPYSHPRAARQAGGSGVDAMTDEQLHEFLKTARRR